MTCVPAARPTPSRTISAVSPPPGKYSEETCGSACASPVSTVVTEKDDFHVQPPSSERMTREPSEASSHVPSGRPAAWATRWLIPGGALMTNQAFLCWTASVPPGHGLAGPGG